MGVLRDGCDPDELADQIQWDYDDLQVAPQRLHGGNWNFTIAGLAGEFAPGRYGDIYSLHFSSGCGPTSSGICSFHVDTANPASMLGAGAAIHGFMDFLGGNTWWKNGGIPRPAGVTVAFP